MEVILELQVNDLALCNMSLDRISYSLKNSVLRNTGKCDIVVYLFPSIHPLSVQLFLLSPIEVSPTSTSSAYHMEIQPN